MRTTSLLVGCLAVLTLVGIQSANWRAASDAIISDDEARSVLGGAPPPCFGDYSFGQTFGCTLTGCVAIPSFALCTQSCTYVDQNPINFGNCASTLGGTCGSWVDTIQKCK